MVIKTSDIFFKKNHKIVSNMINGNIQLNIAIYFFNRLILNIMI